MVSQNRTAKGQFGAHSSQSIGLPSRETGGRFVFPVGEALFGVGGESGRMNAARLMETGVSRDETLPVECDEQNRCQGTGFRAFGVSVGAVG